MLLKTCMVLHGNRYLEEKLVCQGTKMTNCEINNDTEKQFELDKLLIIC